VIYHKNVENSRLMKIHIGKANEFLFIKVLVWKGIENHMTFKLLNASH